MRCITLHQPWASAVMFGPKGIENRDWWPDKPEDGSPLYLGFHAGVGVQSKRQFKYDCDFVRERWPEMPDPETLPRGVVLGAVHILDVVDKLGPTFGELSAAMLDWCNPADVQRYAWVLGDRRPLSEPIQLRGMQKLWWPPMSVQRRLRELVP